MPPEVGLSRPVLEATEDETIGRSRAMASDVMVRAVTPPGVDGLAAAVQGALDIFAAVDSACTRFDPTSSLMRANHGADRFCPVGPTCFEAVMEAHRAYSRTRGRFDPRVLGDLVAMGYDRSLPFNAGGLTTPPAPARRAALPPWRPGFRGASFAVRIGPHPVDLGGIGKGLAVRWASQALRRAAADHLIEAGGDCYCAGSAPGGGLWQVAVEDPAGGADPLAVLGVRDRACATSSIRLRRWRAGQEEVHHLVDPRSGRPGGAGLASVTVVGPDPAEAEVWSKVLFLAGRRQIAALAQRKALAALWVEANGAIATSPALASYLVWGPR
ncbi:MAG TPA: FAD:protein FMN transferase [Acidimicrobiales bacterium]|nr:FAD:protein FMN transferase [Acidimicrobiales bacterium]